MVIVDRAVFSFSFMKFCLEFLQVHFVDAILSNNSTDDHIHEFIVQGGLMPLLKLFSLPALPLDFPTSSACSSITNTCRGILVRDEGVVEGGMNWGGMNVEKREGVMEDVCRVAGLWWLGGGGGGEVMKGKGRPL